MFSPLISSKEGVCRGWRQLYSSVNQWFGLIKIRVMSHYYRFTSSKMISPNCLNSPPPFFYFYEWEKLRLERVECLAQVYKAHVVVKMSLNPRNWSLLQGSLPNVTLLSPRMLFWSTYPGSPQEWEAVLIEKGLS